jgi:hypothetical protein
MNDLLNLTAAAQELVDRLGHGAIRYMEERIEQMRDIMGPRELDQQVRLLSEVEKLLVREN